MNAETAYYSSTFQAVLMLGKAPHFPKEPHFPAAGELASGPVEVEELETCWLKFYGSVPPEFEKMTDFLQTRDKLSAYFERLPDQTFRINFKNYVGLSRLAGFSIRVLNRKISKSQFDAMLNQVCDEYANLVFSFC